jgi:peptide-methionine (S)-S-oxide reductase
MFNKTMMPSKEDALPGRDQEIQISKKHFVNGNPIKSPFNNPDLKEAIFGLGCFWGVEKLFWELSGIYTTAVGYAGGISKNPTYKEVCSGLTGHTEVVLIVYDPVLVNYQSLLKIFWESHNPTQGMQQGNDVGTQYRSVIIAKSLSQFNDAQNSMNIYQKQLKQNKLGKITTEILKFDKFYYAEDYHQQYLAKNPSGYCGLKGLGISHS